MPFASMGVQGLSLMPMVPCMQLSYPQAYGILALAQTTARTTQRASQFA